MTRPASGWPWPWDSSLGTDYSYAFDGGAVWACSFGYVWFAATGKEPDDDDRSHTKTAVFPNMKDRQSVTFGKRSGLIVLGG